MSACNERDRTNSSTNARARPPRTRQEARNACGRHQMTLGAVLPLARVHLGLALTLGHLLRQALAGGLALGFGERASRRLRIRIVEADTREAIGLRELLERDAQALRGFVLGQMTKFR